MDERGLPARSHIPVLVTDFKNKGFIGSEKAAAG